MGNSILNLSQLCIYNVSVSSYLISPQWIYLNAILLFHPNRQALLHNFRLGLRNANKCHYLPLQRLFEQTL